MTIATPSNKAEKRVVIRSSVHKQILSYDLGPANDVIRKRENARFDISTFTSRRNPHVEIDQCIATPSNDRRSVNHSLVVK